DFGYAPLDRYLMGLAGPFDVTAIAIFPREALAQPSASAPIRTISLDDIVRQYGDRDPAPAFSMAIRQAFVIVSVTAAGAAACTAALRRSDFLKRHEERFRAATNNKASLDASL